MCGRRTVAHTRTTCLVPPAGGARNGSSAGRERCSRSRSRRSLVSSSCTSASSRASTSPAPSSPPAILAVSEARLVVMAERWGTLPIRFGAGRDCAALAVCEAACSSWAHCISTATRSSRRTCSACSDGTSSSLHTKDAPRSPKLPSSLSSSRSAGAPGAPPPPRPASPSPSPQPPSPSPQPPSSPSPSPSPSRRPHLAPAAGCRREERLSS